MRIQVINSISLKYSPTLPGMFYCLISICMYMYICWMIFYVYERSLVLKNLTVRWKNCSDWYDSVLGAPDLRLYVQILIPDIL